jgi:hypothetical protein
MQQVQAQLAVPPPAPAPHSDAEETMCVVCMDEAKDRAVRPCMHVCVCETCAQLLMLERTPRCPVCREPIQHIERVFFYRLPVALHTRVRQATVSTNNYCNLHRVFEAPHLAGVAVPSVTEFTLVPLLPDRRVGVAVDEVRRA